MKRIYAAALLLLANIAHADISNCTGVYVGMIKAERDSLMVTFQNSPADSSGSYYVQFTGWSPAEKNPVLALLTAAKLSEHRVNVATLASGECGIASGWQELKSVVLAATP